jgi:hypothetical protein
MPIPKNFVIGIVIAGVVCALILHIKSGMETPLVSWLFGLLSIALLVASWLHDYLRGTGIGTVSSKSLLLWLAGAICGEIAIFAGDFGMTSHWLFTLSCFILFVYFKFVNPSQLTRDILTSLLFSALFLGIASVLGHPGAGGFPAAMSGCFAYVLLVTMRLEQRLAALPAGTNIHDVLYHFRDVLSWTSMVFFLFGVITLWPWLGLIYGDGYFWILIIGVLAPLTYLWGKLRQAHHEIAQRGLIRFNRLSPYVALILLVALAVG